MDSIVARNVDADNGAELPPIALTLMKSLRASGYTLPAALADVCDNLLAANASRIDIRAVASNEPYIATIDDGTAINEQQLVTGMRFGGADPREMRTKGDLGRFGRGMKIASLSQCRRLTVASVRDGGLSIARWDLDACDDKGAWGLQLPGPDVLPEEVRDQLSKRQHGTAVIWQHLDRVMPLGGDPRNPTDQSFYAIDHLAHVFHHFIRGDMGCKVAFTVNSRQLPIADPFLDGHTQGQTVHPEGFTIEGHPVTVAPFALPYPQQLKRVEMDKAGGRESLKTGHGFYIYRSGRRVDPRGWHRIVASEDTPRLARAN